MTVAPLHGWVGIVVLLVLTVLVGVGFVVAGSLSRETSSATEWQSYLQSRSRSPVAEDQAQVPAAHRTGP